MNKQIIAAASVALAIGLGGGYWVAINMAPQQATVPESSPTEREVLFYRNPMNPAITSPVPAKDDMGMDYVPVYAEEAPKERNVLFYRNPMNPAITSPVPAKDDMGMDYVPVYADDSAGDDEPAGTVKIDPVTEQNIGVRTTRAERRTLSRNIRAVGRVDYNEERLARLHPKIEGWVEKLWVQKTGEPVEKDQILLSIYSPQLVASQQEFILALNNREALARSPFEDIRRGAKELVESTRERLQLLDVPAHQLRELEQNREIKKSLHIHSSFDGIVMKLGVREGQYVTPKTELYMLADLSRVWVNVDVYEYELPWINVGDDAQINVAAVPGEALKGKVAYIYPYMESKTRTVTVRLEFDNPGLKLKPDMFANVTLHAGRQVDAVVIPAEAVVRTGSREQVFVVRGPGKFEPREITVGLTSNGLTQVLEGVTPGEEVVSSALFLIDSESKLREATAKMLEAMPSASDAAAESSDMGDMDMGDMDMGDMDMGDAAMNPPEAAAGENP